MENYKKLKTICNLLYIYICKEYKYKNMAKKTKNSNQKLLTDYYKSADKEKNETKIYGFNEKTNQWHCLDCGTNMGDNPRQLCGKYYCIYNYE